MSGREREARKFACSAPTPEQETQREIGWEASRDYFVAARNEPPSAWAFFVCAHDHEFAVAPDSDLGRVKCAICGTVTIQRRLAAREDTEHPPGCQCAEHADKAFQRAMLTARVMYASDEMVGGRTRTERPDEQRCLRALRDVGRSIHLCEPIERTMRIIDDALRDTERPDEDDGWDLDKPQRTKGQALGERVGHVPSDQVEDCERPLSRSVSECCKAWIDVKQGYYCPICGKECSVISKAL
jgi:hypothetical protein